MDKRYFQDLVMGQKFGGPEYYLSEEEIISFARLYDPQSFHTNPKDAVDSFFGQHVASGWQTASIGMRLLVTGEHRFAGGMIGLGVEGIRWRKPTLPGMKLKMESEITDLRRSGKFKKHGIVKLKNLIFDAETKDQLAEMNTIQIVELRP